MNQTTTITTTTATATATVTVTPLKYGVQSHSGRKNVVKRSEAKRSKAKQGNDKVQLFDLGKGKRDGKRQGVARHCRHRTYDYYCSNFVFAHFLVTNGKLLAIRHALSFLCSSSLLPI